MMEQKKEQIKIKQEQAIEEQAIKKAEFTKKNREVEENKKKVIEDKILIKD